MVDILTMEFFTVCGAVFLAGFLAFLFTEVDTWTDSKAFNDLNDCMLNRAENDALRQKDSFPKP